MSSGTEDRVIFQQPTQFWGNHAGAAQNAAARESLSLRRATHAADRLGARLARHLVSILYYPEPFYNGGLVAIFRDDAEPFVDLIAEAYKCVPQGLFLHCLRRGELNELCLPSFNWLHVLNRHVQLSYRVKLTGTTLFGADLRDEVALPADPQVLLDAHIESCAHFMRNHGALRLLAAGKYSELIKRIDWQIRCLMSTALLGRADWDAPLEEIPARFGEAYADEQLQRLWGELRELERSINPQTDDSWRPAAFEAAWIFECFLRRLRAYASPQSIQSSEALPEAEQLAGPATISIEVAEYKRAVDDFLRDLRQLGEDVVSVILYGSIARGQIVRGRSDLLDGYVFLRDQVFEEKARFLRALGVMVESCQTLCQTGIRFHPYHYFARSEASLSPAMYLAHWQSNQTSAVLMGADIRAQIRSTERSRATAATSFFEARRTMAHPLAAYLNLQDWSADDQHKIVHRLTSLKKHICEMACITLEIPKAASQAVVALEQVLPLDFSVLQRIESFSHASGSLETRTSLRETLRDMLSFVEDLHDRIIEARPLNSFVTRP